MKNNQFLHRRKGQSAIEYLMTYGWMLLVVAIVGGAIFATVQGQCTKSQSGFTGTAAQISEWGVTDTNMQIDFENKGSEQINITQVEILDEEGSSIELNQSYTAPINVGDSVLYRFNNVASGEGCNTFNVEVTFDKGSITGQVASGTLTGQMQDTS